MPAPSLAKDLMSRDIMSEAQHCTAMNSWPNTIQCFGSDDMMSPGIKSFAAEGVHDKVHDKVHERYRGLGTKIFGGTGPG